MTADELLASVPARVLLGLGLVGLTPEQVRDRLAAVCLLDPAGGADLASRLAECALALIRDGHRQPDVLARDTLTVLSGAAGWSA